jgi:hypothetical protein
MANRSAGPILPGADVRAIRSAGRRGMEVWFEDGIPELQLGAAIIANGLISFALGAVPGVAPLVGDFLLLALIGFGTVAGRWFRERVIAPRSGSVEPRPPRAAMAVIGVVIAVLLATAMAWPPLFSGPWRGHRADVEAVVVPFLPLATGVLFGGLIAWAARISGIGTLYRVAAGALVLGLLLPFSSLRGYPGAGLVALYAGLFTAGDGAFRMRRYLRRTSP